MVYLFIKQGVSFISHSTYLNIDKMKAGISRLRFQYKVNPIASKLLSSSAYLLFRLTGAL
jgi:hypothetical protein